MTVTILLAFAAIQTCVIMIPILKTKAIQTKLDIAKTILEKLGILQMVPKVGPMLVDPNQIFKLIKARISINLEMRSPIKITKMIVFKIIMVSSSSKTNNSNNSINKSFTHLWKTTILKQQQNKLTTQSCIKTRTLNTSSTRTNSNNRQLVKT